MRKLRCSKRAMLGNTELLFQYLLSGGWLL